MSKTSIKYYRQQGEVNDGHAPCPPRCDTCRKLNAGPSSKSPLSRRSGGGSGAPPPIPQRQRSSFAYYLIAALTIASAALSSMGSVKSVGTPLAVVAASPIHHSSIRRGNFVGSIATLFLSTEAVRTGSILYPPLADATLMSAAVPPTLVVEKGDATLAHEGDLGFNSIRFLQSVEADHDIDREDHDIDID